MQRRFGGWVLSNVENYPPFLQTLYLPSSERIYNGCAFWRVVSGELDLLQLIGGAERPWHKQGCRSNHNFVFTVKMATAMLAETLDNSEHSTLLITETRSCTLNCMWPDAGTWPLENKSNVATWDGSYWQAMFQKDESSGKIIRHTCTYVSISSSTLLFKLFN
jgi:hypothetical protein